ncbi:MAG: site-specific DNA-methyltransferase, partial [Acidimicrobiaceae bacterium]|nr:site-specific DNA-methyltransferase [Acidimicrobiaceae bacterium]
APFPIELPARLIDLYTYRHDLVLDPFAGSGTTAVAALRADRHFVCYDNDPSYIQLAESRLAEERVGAAPPHHGETAYSRAVRAGRAAKDIARLALEAAGFTDVQPGDSVTFSAQDCKGKLWWFEVSGSFTAHRAGLARTDVLWKTLGKAAVLRETSATPLVLLTTGTPDRGSPGAEALRHMTGPTKAIRDVVNIVEPPAVEHLRALCGGRRLR